MDNNVTTSALIWSIHITSLVLKLLNCRTILHYKCFVLTIPQPHQLHKWSYHIKCLKVGFPHHYNYALISCNFLTMYDDERYSDETHLMLAALWILSYWSDRIFIQRVIIKSIFQWGQICQVGYVSVLYLYCLHHDILALPIYRAYSKTDLTDNC